MVWENWVRYFLNYKHDNTQIKKACEDIQDVDFVRIDGEQAGDFDLPMNKCRLSLESAPIFGEAACRWCRLVVGFSWFPRALRLFIGCGLWRANK